MLSGVGKSGSPAPKSTTSTPCWRSRSASAATFMVEETLMEEIRSAISMLAWTCMLSILTSFIQCRDSGKAIPEAFLDDRRDQPGNIAAQPEHLFHQPGAEERMRLARQQKKRFHLRPQTAIHQGHLQLVFVIGNCPDAAQHRRRAP